MSDTFPRNLPKPNETVIIGGLTLAGRVKSIPEASPEWRLDQQSSSGMNGAVWVHQGFKCAEFTLQMECLDSTEWPKYEAFASTYGPTDLNRKPVVLPIVNAQLNRKGVNIRKVFVKKISLPKWSDTDSSWTYDVQLVQIVPTKTKKTSVVESKYDNGLIDPKNKFALPDMPFPTPATQKTAPSGWLGVLNGKGAKK